MAASIDDVIKRIEDSGILSDAELSAVGEDAQTVDGDAQKLVRLLVKNDRLTAYQAQAIWKDKGHKLSFGNYLVESELGRGGMGVVLKARHKRMKRHVAIKVLPAKMTSNADAIARFQREVEAAAQLSHTNIVGAHDADEIDGQHFLVMEYVDGRNLSSVVKGNGPLPIDQAVTCVIQAARGLEFAHQRGVIHRDIKPANLLLDNEGTVKILDMGLARFSDTADVDTQAELTGTGTVMGTVDYMSPEQALNTKTADARSDIYSLGITLYYLLVARPAYEGDTMMARLLAHANQPIPSLRDSRPDVAEPVQAIFEKMVAKQADDRYQSMTDVVADLERSQGDGAASSVNVAQLQSQPAAPTGPSELSNLLVASAPTVGEMPATTPPQVDNHAPTVITQASADDAVAATFVTPPAPVDSGTPTIVTSSLSNTIQTGTIQRGRGAGSKAGRPTWMSDKRILGGIGGGVLLLIVIAVLAFKSDPVPDPSDEKVASIGKGQSKASSASTDQTGTNKEVGTATSAQAPVEPEFALEFDGDDYVSASMPDVPIGDEYTVEAWVEIKDRHDRDTYGGVILHWQNKSNVLLARHHWKKTATNNITGSYQGQQGYLAASADRFQGRKHLAVVYSEQKISIYIDGQRMKKTGYFQGDGYQSPESQLLVIGAEGKGDQNFFTGRIDEVRVSSVARYDDDFQPKQRLATDGDTLALYHFDAGQGDVLKDASGNNHHGKIVGAKWVRPGEQSLEAGQPASVSLIEMLTSSDYEWTEPTNLGPQINSSGGENNPTASGDGLILMFDSNRGVDPVRMFECRRSSVLEPWSAPRAVDELNRIKATDPQLSRDGLTLLFTAPSDGEIKRLWRTRRTTRNSPWQEPVNLGSEFDSDKRQGGGRHSPDGLTLYFRRWSDSRNYYEQWQAHRTAIDSPWGNASLLSLEINSPNGGPGGEVQPLADGKSLLFTRGWGQGQLYLGKPNVSGKFQVQNLKTELPFHNFALTDECTLLFTNRDTEGGFGKGDLWMSRRVRKGEAATGTPRATGGSPGNASVPPPAVAPFDAAAAKIHQEAWAKHLGTTVVTVDGVGQRLVLIPPGEFSMGSTDAQVASSLKMPGELNPFAQKRIEESERPRHMVKITRPLRVGATEVTVGQFRKFVQATGYVTVLEENGLVDPMGNPFEPAVLAGFEGQNWRTPGYDVTDDLPVTHVDPKDAEAYCQWLSERESTEYRLPTEAEWEYVCRAGTTTHFSFGDDEGLLSTFAWTGANSRGQPRPVGGKAGNQFGIHDMHGNLGELCQDRYEASWYARSPTIDPLNAIDGNRPVTRGSAWKLKEAAYFRSATRSFYFVMSPVYHRLYGFRVVRVLGSGKTARTQAPPPAVAPFDAATAKAHQTAWGKHLGEPVVTTNSIGMKLAVIPPGSFRMGEFKNVADMTLTRPCRFGVHEVTQAQWRAIMENEPWRRSGDVRESDNLPAVRMSWDAAVDFCRRLTERDRAAGVLREGWAYRLPSEAEWEFACRAGTTTHYTFADDGADLGDYAWYDANTKHAGEVGLKKPNPWGLHDVHGNVWEWCHDWRASEISSGVDSFGPDEGNMHVFRGGSWALSAWSSRSSQRGGGAPVDTVGLRVALCPQPGVIVGKVESSPPEIGNAAPPPAVAPFDQAQAKAHQEAWAKHLGMPVEKEVELPGGETMAFMLIPPGEFSMGSDEAEREAAVDLIGPGINQATRDKVASEGPLHRVKINEPFYLGMSEVTQQQWKGVFGELPEKVEDNPTHPVVQIGRNDIQPFLDSLNEKDGNSGGEFFLPTEAQWEYACRAGTDTRWYFENSDAKIENYAWIGATSGYKLQPTKGKKPNAFGLYDMSGNAWEWCNGTWSIDGYSQSSNTEADSASKRNVLRGGGCDSHAWQSRSANREHHGTGFRWGNSGFRIALTIDNTKLDR